MLSSKREERVAEGREYPRATKAIPRRPAFDILARRSCEDHDEETSRPNELKGDEGAYGGLVLSTCKRILRLEHFCETFA